MSFPEPVEIAALTACERCCCICHNFCGTKIELHHIKQKADGGEDTFENCIPLCFDCHADMGKADPRHPKGKHYSAKELIRHRDNWYQKVKNSREGLQEASSEDIENLFTKGKPTAVVSKEIPNTSGGHTVIIDDERYINEKVMEEFTEDIVKRLKEI